MWMEASLRTRIEMLCACSDALCCVTCVQALCGVRYALCTMYVLCTVVS